MQGSPRRKGNTDYLQFKPYRAIVAPQLSRHRPEGPLSAALKSGLIVALILGIPMLLIVPIVTYFTSDFVNGQHFAEHTVKNMLLPSLAVLGVAFCGGVVSLIRR
jgi:hypothetical protein